MDCEDNCTGSIIVDVDYGLTGDFYNFFIYQDIEYQYGSFATEYPVKIDNLCTRSYANIRVDGLNTTCSEIWGSPIAIRETGAEWKDVTQTSNASNCSGICDGSFTIDTNLTLTREFLVSYVYDGTTFEFGPYNFVGDLLFDDLCAGAYSDIKIASAESGRTDVWPSSIVTFEPYSEVEIQTISDDNCQEEGTTTLYITGGDAPHTISWKSLDGSDSGTTTLKSTRTIILDGFIDGNTYCISVVDYNGFKVN